MIAWNFEFPTYVEQILWRTAVLVSVGLPPIALLLVPVCAALHKRVEVLNPYNFMGSCLLAIREFAWQEADQQARLNLLKCLKSLEEAYDDPKNIEKRYYKDIFRNNENEQLFKSLGDFIKKRKDLFPMEFHDQFKRLLNMMQEDTYPKDAYRLDSYPQLTLRWPIIILSATGIVYCITRVAIIILAFSCLRLMPDSVYVTSWANFIPNVQ